MEFSIKVLTPPANRKKWSMRHGTNWHEELSRSDLELVAIILIIHPSSSLFLFFPAFYFCTRMVGARALKGDVQSCHPSEQVMKKSFIKLKNSFNSVIVSCLRA